MIYKAAIVGLGRMGQFFEDSVTTKKPCTHAGAYTYLKDKIKLVAGCDIREDRLEVFGKKMGVNKLYKDYKEMLKKEGIDILSVCTDAPSHKEIVIAAAKSGVKAIFCEKPISTNLRDAQEMIDVCKKNNVILCIDYTRRFDNQWRKVKEYLENGIIGNLDTIHVLSPAGLLNGGSHLFDLLRFYNGEVESVYGKLIKDHVTDLSGFGILKFKNGSYAFIDSGFREYVLVQMSMNGSNGFLKIGGMIRGDKTFELFLSKSSLTQLGVNELQREPLPEEEEGISLVNAINEIIESIETGKKPSSSGEDGIAALEIAMAFYESDKKNKPVTLPIENRDRIIIPRKTSFSKDGEFPLSYVKYNKIPHL